MTVSDLANGARLLIAVLAALCFALPVAHANGEVVLWYELETAKSGARGLERKLDSAVKVINGRIGNLGRATLLPNKRIEIKVLGESSDDKLESIKRRVSVAGYVEIRELAHPGRAEDRRMIEQAQLLPSAKKEINVTGIGEAKWVAFSNEDLGPDAKKHLAIREIGDASEALVLVDSLHITGEYLTAAAKVADDQCGSALELSFNSKGIERLNRLASENRIEEDNELEPLFGFILDDRLIAGVKLQGETREKIRIWGPTITDREIDNLIAIFDAGLLSHALKEVRD